MCFTTYGSHASWSTSCSSSQKDLKAVGIDAKIDQKEYGAYISTCFYGKFDSTTYGPQTGFLEPDNFLFGQYYPEELKNQSHINDPVVADMLVRQRRTFDVAKRRELIFEIQRYLATKQYYVQMPSGVYVARVGRCGEELRAQHGLRLRRAAAGGLARSLGSTGPAPGSPVLRRYVAKRLLIAIPSLLIASLIVFTLPRLIPGDAVQLMLAEKAYAKDIDELRAKLGLDRPIYVQYFEWAGRAVRGDLGESLWTRRPVLEEIGQRLPVTLLLAVLALTFALAIAIPVGRDLRGAARHAGRLRGPQHRDPRPVGARLLVGHAADRAAGHLVGLAAGRRLRGVLA